MNGQAIIDLFDTLTDGLSELTEANKIALLNRKYKDLINKRDWEELRTSTTASISSGAFSLAADFKKFTPNEHEGETSGFKHLFYIDQTPHPIIRFAERRRFTDYAYHDIENDRVVTPTSLNGYTASYDYFKTVSDLTTATSPVFSNSDYHKAIAYLMAIEHYSIDQTEAGRSKAQDYLITVEDIIADMEYDDTQLKESGLEYA